MVGLLEIQLSDKPRFMRPGRGNLSQTRITENDSKGGMCGKGERMTINPSECPKRSKVPFKFLWIPASVGIIAGGIVCGALSAFGHPLSEMTEKPGRPVLFCAIVDGSLGAYHGALLGIFVGLCYKTPCIFRWFSHKA